MIGGLAWCLPPGFSAGNSDKSGLAKFEVIKHRTESGLPPAPADRNGVWEELDMKVAEWTLFRDLLPNLRAEHPDLISYWIVRTEDAQESWDPSKREPKPGFEHTFPGRVAALVTSMPELSKWGEPLKTASGLLLQDVWDEFGVRSNDFTPIEKSDLLDKVHKKIQKHRGQIIDAIRSIVNTIGTLDPEANGQWKPIYDFLVEDVNTTLAAALADRGQKLAVAHELRGTFLNATKPPATLSASYEKLEGINEQLVSLRVQMIEKALAPGQTLAAFARSDARDYLDLQRQFDEDLVQAIDQVDDPSWVRVFDGVFDVRASLNRHEGYLKFGYDAESVDLLREIAETYVLGVGWGEIEIDTETGGNASASAVHQGKQTVAALGALFKCMVGGNKRECRLYAALAIDSSGNAIHTHSNWIEWKWILPEEFEDLTIDGRIVTVLGRRWLLPAGSSAKALTSIDDLYAAKAKELVAALDFSGN